MSLFSWYIDSYLDLSAGFMYQSKPSFRPGESRSSSTCSNCTCLPVIARPACTRWDLDSGTSQSGKTLGTSAYSYKCFENERLDPDILIAMLSLSALHVAATNPVDYIKDDTHGDAELLKVQVAVVVDVGHVPDLLELVVAQAAVLQQRRRHLARQEFGTIGPGCEDVPVRLDLRGLNSGGHDG